MTELERSNFGLQTPTSPLLLRRHKPVAVTPQLTVKVKLELAGKPGMSKPACKLAMAIGAVGQVAVVDAQVTLVHCSPGAAGSANCELLAADGPWLATTMT